MNSGFPGWLYEVDMGATTIWERWNSLMPDGTPNPDGMNSYNHYAYGSVMEFVYRRIAGIEAKEAGFAKIKIAPHPCKGLPVMKAEYESVRGKIVSGYSQKDGKIEYVIEIPEGAEAEIKSPSLSKAGNMPLSGIRRNLIYPTFPPCSRGRTIFSSGYNCRKLYFLFRRRV